jgi:hypothetical protein
LVSRSWLQTRRLHAFAVARSAQAGALDGIGHPVALQPPFQNVSVVADDAAAQPRVDEAITDLNIILPQFAGDYAPPPSTHLTVHLTAQEAVARQVMTRNLSMTQNRIDGFFASKQRTNVASGSGSDGGFASVIYLPNSTDIRPLLAADAGFYYLLSLSGGANSSGVYPYWFSRGFGLYMANRFSEGGWSVPPSSLTLHQTAVNDVQAGTAPSLASISLSADVTASETEAANNAGHVDARSEATVEYLAHQYGEAALGRLLRGDASGSIARFNGLLQQVTGMGLDELNAAVTGSLR